MKWKNHLGHLTADERLLLECVLEEMSYGEGDWIYLAQDGVKWQAVLNTVTNVCFPPVTQFFEQLKKCYLLKNSSPLYLHIYQHHPEPAFPGFLTRQLQNVFDDASVKLLDYVETYAKLLINSCQTQLFVVLKTMPSILLFKSSCLQTVAIIRTGIFIKYKH